MRSASENLGISKPKEWIDVEKSLTFLALDAAIRRAGCVPGIIGNVAGPAVSSSPATTHSSRRRR